MIMSTDSFGNSKGFPDYSSFPRVLMVQVLSGSCGEFFTVMVSMP